VVLTGGTLTSRPSEFEALLVQPACRWERSGSGDGGPGALLGPEGTGRSSEWTSPRWLRASAAADVRIGWVPSGAGWVRLRRRWGLCHGQGQLAPNRSGAPSGVSGRR
jgi:hypothetical protein